ncbi:hypothetical protein SELMODRAFT_124836 [Selaginella moellendorffii]|uniref:DUF6817 domain-containing protein n=1 Tax=Selaginella moellendorffii TaxID=88036 RepID=D8STY4_SELML|nr:uncharacterized protein LOC9641512 [Selaginella moellendorffii]EFJ12102.1 hypothetical protein SELMODRAFT_124836 [Selaginella moellendorffii]|eukprot:XP_002986772.1 uncharacterized protein LOC9641512 [Selaginella moellendorffii]
MEKARLFLREEYAAIDPALPHWLSVLRSTGASECFHKHGTFFQHLVEVYRILKLWGAPDDVCRCGLFHSSYSNSYVNLAIFEPGVDRSRVKDLIGDPAEQLVELFCIVPRQELIHDMLLFRFSDDQLQEAAASDRSCKKSKLLLPDGFITVKNIRNGEDVRLPRRIVAVFVLLTMADFCDQLYNWQDNLFDNRDGELRFSGNHYWALWPGDVQPGLWMSSISRMGLLLKGLLNEEEQDNGICDAPAAIALKLPPLFDGCSKLLRPVDQIAARDLYLEAVGADLKRQGFDWIAGKLRGACERNPWIGEPHLVLAQLCCLEGAFEEAAVEAALGLERLLQWGTAWDKRVAWEAWIAWGRVLEMNAKEKKWPSTAWGMINLGLVK